MANLGNVGKTFAQRLVFRAPTVFMLDKVPTSVDMNNSASPSGIPSSFAVMTRNAVVVDRTKCDSSGVFHFYDMDDSGSQLYAIATYTQSGATGEAWVASVVGSVVTITKTFAASRAQAVAFGG